ncbi:anti-sigma factor family protein [Caballeronia concitans]|uniref:Transmembrane anti-sigma factor n=1 Tax=Caballeronia concitans TaxID=1777133 RepID=A0A658R3G9_9BURK|nr:zf-HC2 domain-containing protein [Caballeronia concitans]KIG01725.1 putative transmembrane anti-sigma factor [Burkholderia sp. MR1]SAL46894.1 transmembrane anti-sigma factor [Caballeronia concitans]
MMNVDDSLLMSYVDGELSPEQRAEVEAAIAHSDELAARAAALQASVLPYRAAYDRQTVPPVPESLTRRIEELVSVSTTQERKRSRGSRRFSMFPMQWAAAAFVAGAICSGVLTGYLGGYNPFNRGADPWVQSVADYQVLYGRDTVSNLREDKVSTQQVLADIHQRDGMPIDVPDLREAGLKFKRVQRLNYHDRPLIQMVYLPERGDPVALCVIEENKGDAPVHAGQVGEMKTVTWRTNRLAYVLLAKAPSLDLQAVGNSIASGKTVPLYSSGDADVSRDS